MTSNPPEADRPVWGEGVRVFRGIRDNMTQAELAKLAGVSQSSISQIENGARQVSDAARVRIARALGLEPHLLFPYLEDGAA